MSSVQEDFGVFNLDRFSVSFSYLSNMQKMCLDIGCNVQKFRADVFSLSKHQSREVESCTYDLEADV